MFSTTLRFLTIIVVLVGLAWVYTLLYGGPFIPFFRWLAQYMPGSHPINLMPGPMGSALSH